MIQKFEFDFVLSMFACVCVCYFCVYAYICMLLVCKFVCKCVGVYERERDTLIHRKIAYSYTGKIKFKKITDLQIDRQTEEAREKVKIFLQE